MSELRPISGKKVIKALERLGFVFSRTNGSHVILKSADGKTVVVPVHGGRDIPRPTLRSIVLKQAKITEDDFLKVL